jgi:hypothetical protein
MNKAKHTIPGLYIFLILLSAVPGHSLDFLQDLGFRGGVLASQQGRFEQKTQGSSLVEFQNILSGTYLAAALSLGYHKVSPSNLSGGWGYRGLEGYHLWLGAEWYFLNQQSALVRGPAETGQSRSLPPRFGLSLALGGFYSTYQYTDILFFYTALRMNLFADLFFSSPFRLRVGLPTELYFRRDLDSCAATGIGLWAGISWDRLVGGDP